MSSGRGVSATPEDLEKVAAAIATAENDIKNAIQKMQSTLNAANWHDPVRTRFDADFTALLTGLRAFQSKAPEHITYLRRKATELRRFLGT